MIDCKILSANIKKYRQQKHYTQADLAGLMFVTPQTVSKWEKGLAIPDIVKLDKLCDLLGVGISDILEEQHVKKHHYYIGIDGGGTKTEFALFDRTGTVLGRMLLSGSNPNVSGFDKACRTLKQGIDALLAISPDVDAIFGGIAGSIPGENKGKLTAFLKKQYPACHILVDSDIQNVIYSSRVHEKCIAGIIGTGSVVYAHNAEGTFRVGGWGYLFDGSGSGYDIGRDVISACFAYDDGLAEYSELVRLCEVRLGMHASAMMDQIYQMGKDGIASFAGIAFEAYRSGDPVAAEILRRNARHLSALANHAYRAYDCGDTLILSGGLTFFSDIYDPLIKEELDPAIKTVYMTRPQIYGACRKCLYAFDIPFDENEFDQNFDNDYRRLKEND